MLINKLELLWTYKIYSLNHNLGTCLRLLFWPCSCRCPLVTYLTTYFSHYFQRQEDIWFCLIGNAFPCIQTFLFMSGFLLSYNVLKYLSSYKKTLAIPILLLLARRYIRLTTPIIFLVGLFLVLPRFISGPIYSEYKGIVFGSCEINWWRVLLHINNWVPFFDMCLAHLWYVSVDWQIYSTLWVSTWRSES